MRVPRFRWLLSLGLLLAVSCGKDGTSPKADPPTSVRITPSSATLDWIGATVQLTGTPLGTTGLSLTDPVSWSSSNTNVATISATGLVTAVAVGTTTISATAGSASKTATVFVRQIPASIVKISGDGQTGTANQVLAEALVVRIDDLGGTPAANGLVAWTVRSGGGSLETSGTKAGVSGQASARWRLGTAGAQTLKVSIASGDSVVFSALAEAPSAARVELTPAVDTVGAAGDTTRFSATAYADDGSVIAGAPVIFRSGDTAVATVSTDGLATAVAEGSTDIVVTSGSAADTSRFVVDFSYTGFKLSIQTIQPSILVEGQTATITGTGFGATTAENEVTVDGLAATVTSATATQIRFTVPTADCEPPRTTTLSVARAAKHVTAQVKVTPATLVSLAVFEGKYVPGGGSCLPLASGQSGELYLIGALSVSEDPASLTSASLFARTGENLQSPTPPALEPGFGFRIATAAAPTPSAPAGEVAPDRAAHIRETLARHWKAEAGIREGERRLVRELGGWDRVGTVSKAWRTTHRVPAAAPVVGDTLTLHAGTSCTDRPTIQAVVRYVGSAAVWVEDVDNPDLPLTASDLEPLDDLYEAAIRPVHTDYFGTTGDIDGNGKILVLLTKEVNKEKNGTLGYVWGGDLYPTALCGTSNYAEIYYGIVPDPAGSFGDKQARADVLGLYPLLLAHEMTHIIQFSQIIFGQAGIKSRWELEGGATLAEQLTANRLYGYESGQDLGWSVVDAHRDWYFNFVADLATYFGYSPDGRVGGAPEECTWTGNEDEGNSGPCIGGRDVYGVPATLFRYVLDVWGPGYTGGEKAMMRRLTQSPETGFADLEDVTGESMDYILTTFGSGLYADGRYYDALLSWNLDDIFNHLVSSARLEPYESTSSEPTMSVNVRGGSTAYLLWPVGAHAPTSLRLRAPDDGKLPEDMVLWILRLK